MSGRLKIVRVYRQAYNAAIRAGWTIELTGSSHLRWRPPDGQFVITPSTPNHPNGIGVARDLARLRRAGLEWGGQRR